MSKLKLNPAQTKEMIKFAVRNPEPNAVSIMSRGFDTLGLNGQSPELVALPSFNDSYDAYELTKIGTLRN